MADEIVLYTHPFSRGRVARWMLEETGAPYRAEILGFGKSMKTPAYLAINPMGKVPAIVHGDTVVTEVSAICAYLADAFPEAGLAPAPTSRARGPYYRWMFFNAGCVEAALTNKSLGVVVPDDKRGMVGYGSVDHVVSALEGLLSTNDYVLGSTFSAADVSLGSQIGWALQFGTLPASPTFERYRDRVHARPAAIRAREIDDKLAAEITAAAEAKQNV